MEMILNLAWAACSLALICFWLRSRNSQSAQRGTGAHAGSCPSPCLQILALSMVVILLLPVISLSDDLIAMQGPAEADSCVRRGLHSDEWHPSVVPASMAMPEPVFAAPATSVVSQESLQTYAFAPPSRLLYHSLDSRPPPQA